MEKVFQITLDAKALWGSEIVCQICGIRLNMNTGYCCLGKNATPSCFAWEYHLEQLSVLTEEEKIKYVSRFILRDE